MKLIIDILEVPLYRDMYTAICENGYIFDEDNEYIAKVIKNGTPISDNATNGDVITTILNPYKICEYEYSIHIYMTEEDFWKSDYQMNCNADWWNAPYQKGGKE